MHSPTLLVVSLLGLLVRTHAFEVGPHFNELEAGDIEMAMACLQENYCQQYKIPKRSNIRCRINDAIAYVCNYAGGGPVGFKEDGAQNPCDMDEMKTAARELREGGQKQKDWNKEYMNGWWYEKDWAKAYGFEVPCPGDERDCEAQCGNNWNLETNSNYFDFDMECTNTPGVGRGRCILHSITSYWEKNGKATWPWIDDELNLGLPEEYDNLTVSS